MNENIDNCLDIISKLELNIRHWGKYISRFTDNLLSLQKQDICVISDLCSPEFKFDFLCQLIGHARRQAEAINDPVDYEHFRWLLAVLVFENFDFDYRENFMRFQPILSWANQNSRAREKLLDEWESMKPLASGKTIKYMDLMLGDAGNE